jgi:hypothetical protein
MRQHIVALDDIWWICMICGRQKPVEPEPIVKPVPQPSPVPWALAVLSPKNKRVVQKRSNRMGKTLSDLNDVLFAQLDRLSESDLSGEKLQDEIHRSKAISGVAREVVENAKLALEAQRSLGGSGKTAPPMLGVS